MVTEVVFVACVTLSGITSVCVVPVSPTPSRGLSAASRLAEAEGDVFEARDVRWLMSGTQRGGFRGAVSLACCVLLDDSV